MSVPTRIEILGLYRKLLRYSENLKFTDKEYYLKRIRESFRNSKSIEQVEDINFQYKPANALGICEKLLGVRFIRKEVLDWTKFPELHEKDLEEQFVRGSGPGGQAVAKTNNCVVLKHIPTGIVVKCHETRSQDRNRKSAREIMLQRLDGHLNGERSIEAQKKQILQKKLANRESKAKKLREKKLQFKSRQNLDENVDSSPPIV